MSSKKLNWMAIFFGLLALIVVGIFVSFGPMPVRAQEPEPEDPCEGYQAPDLGVAPYLTPFFYGDQVDWTGWNTATIRSSAVPTVTVKWTQSMNDSIVISKTEILKDGSRVFYGGEDATIGLGPRDGIQHKYEFRMTGRGRRWIGNQCSAYSAWNGFETSATYHITWDWWRVNLPIVKR